ncbi:SCO family protein [bacterium]|nr:MULTISPECIES: SCO family protein [Pirellulaceae]MDB4338595.1 SCO family protein [Rubripirellula sp.]MDB4678935.1 SCO family protein [Rhodopirellula sp.]MDC0279079.1 SCO family protein [bacterium]
MRTAVHIGVILLTGVVLGLGFRWLRLEQRDSLPGPDEEIYTNSQAIDGLTPEEIESIENPDPSHPPEGEDWLSRFELMERNGEMISSDDLLGTPYVVSFFFSTCPSICIQQNQKIKELQDEFLGKGVRFVAISVDPETDSPEQLTEYAARFGADPQQWLFLTGDLTYIRRVGAEVYRQPVDKQFHTERLVLVDPTGEIEGYYSWPEEAQFGQLKTKIREYLDTEIKK